MYRNDVKKVRFFRDGDANFSGVNIAISRSRYRNFDSLLNDLSRKVPLPFGVRTLHTPGGAHHVYDIDQIEDGKDYVCSTFHSRPIKRLNYAGNMSRNSWKPTLRKNESILRNDKQNEPSEKLFQTRNLKPKSITVIAKDDASNRARVILNRRTAMTYESVLQTVSDILQLNSGPVKDLYTLEGKKVGGIADLVHGPDVFLAAGRNSGSISARSMPSRLLKSKKGNAGILQTASATHSKSAAGPWRKEKTAQKKSPYTQPIFSKKKENKAKANAFVVTVKTSDIEDAGTEGKVAVVVCGSKGSTGELTLGPPSSKKFGAGTKEEFEINVGNIGKMQKLRILHSSVEDELGWHLNEILLTSLARSGEEYLFQCDHWLSNKEEGDVSVLELPAIVKSKPVAKVVTYEVTVMTGDLPTAATDASVFVTIFGEIGDTGKRWLKKSETSGSPFSKGNIDIFNIDAVCLGKLIKILIGHDNDGDTPGWYLEKVIVKDTEESREYSFPCRRFLDEDEGDGKTEATIKASLVSDSHLSKEQLWQANAWKFQDSNEITLVSVINGNFLRIDADTSEAYADEEDCKNCLFNTSKGGESTSRIFTVKAKEHDYNLTLDNGVVSGRKGNPGLLSEFYVVVLEDNCVTLESVVHKGVFVSVSESGKAEPGDESLGESIKFNINVKGAFRNLGRIKLRPYMKNGIVIESSGNLYGDGENDDDRGEFVVHKTGLGTRAFQSAVTDKFINVSADEISCKGEDKDDEECQFKVHRDRTKGLVRLESIKMPGVFLGICATGRIKHAVDAGDITASLSIDIISLGEKRKRRSPSLENEYASDNGFDDNEAEEDTIASGRQSNVTQKSNEEDADYNEDDFENEGSRPASQDSGRSSPRASSRGNSSASSRRDSRASARMRSRPTSRKTASRPSSMLSQKSTNEKDDNVEEDNKAKDEADGRPVSSTSEKSISRPGTGRSEPKENYGSGEDEFEKDSEGEGGNEKGEGEEKYKHGTSRPASTSSQKTVSRSASAMSASGESGGDDDLGDNDKDGDATGIVKEGSRREEEDSRPGSAASKKDRATPAETSKQEAKESDEGGDSEHLVGGDITRSASATSGKASGLQRPSSSSSVRSAKNEATEKEDANISLSRPTNGRSSKKEMRPSSKAGRPESSRSERNDELQPATAEVVSSRPASRSSDKGSSRPSSTKSDGRPEPHLAKNASEDADNVLHQEEAINADEKKDDSVRENALENDESDVLKKEKDEDIQEDKGENESLSGDKDVEDPSNSRPKSAEKTIDKEDEAHTEGVAENQKEDDAKQGTIDDEAEKNKEEEKPIAEEKEGDVGKEAKEINANGEAEEERQEARKEEEDPATDDTKNNSSTDKEEVETEEKIGEEEKNTENGQLSRVNSISSRTNAPSRQGSSNRESRPASHTAKAGVYESLVRGQSPPISRDGSAASIRSKPASSRGSRRSAKKNEEKEDKVKEEDNDVNNVEDKDTNVASVLEEDSIANGKDTAENVKVAKEDDKNVQEEDENDKVKEENKKGKENERNEEGVDDDVEESQEKDARGENVNKKVDKDDAGDKSNEEPVDNETHKSEEVGAEGEKENNPDERDKTESSSAVSDGKETNGLNVDDTEQKDKNVVKNDDEKERIVEEKGPEDGQKLEDATGEKGESDADSIREGEGERDSKDQMEDKSGEDGEEKTSDDIIKEGKEKNETQREKEEETVGDENELKVENDEKKGNDDVSTADEQGADKQGIDEQDADEQGVGSDRNIAKETEKPAEEPIKTGAPANSTTNQEGTTVNSPILSPTPPKTPRNSLTARRPSSRLSNPSGSKADLRSSIKSPNSLENSNENRQDESQDDANKMGSGNNDDQKQSKESNGNDSHDEDKKSDEDDDSKTAEGNGEEEENGEKKENMENSEGNSEETGQRGEKAEDRVQIDENADENGKNEENAENKVKSEENAEDKVQSDKDTEVKVQSEENAEVKVQSEENPEDKVQSEENSEVKVQSEENTGEKGQNEENAGNKVKSEENAEDKIQSEENTKDKVQNNEDTEVKVQSEENAEVKVQSEENTEDKIQSEDNSEVKVQSEDNTEVKGQDDTNAEAKSHNKGDETEKVTETEKESENLEGLKNLEDKGLEGNVQEDKGDSEKEVNNNDLAETIIKSDDNEKKSDPAGEPGDAEEEQKEAEANP